MVKVVYFMALCIAVVIIKSIDKKYHAHEDAVSVFSGIISFLYIATAIFIY